MEFGERLGVRELLHDAVFKALLQCFRRHVLHVGGAHRKDGRVARGDDRVGANLAVAGFVHEALAGLRIDHEAVAHDRFNDLGRDAEARLVGRGPGAELNPVHLDFNCAGAVRCEKRVACGARLVRAFELRAEARIVDRAKPHVLAEAAARKDDALLGAVESLLAAAFLREAVAFFDFSAEHGAVLRDELREARS